LRGGKGATFMVGAGRHLASLRHCLSCILPVFGSFNMLHCKIFYFWCYFRTHAYIYLFRHATLENVLHSALPVRHLWYLEGTTRCTPKLLLFAVCSLIPLVFLSTHWNLLILSMQYPGKCILLPGARTSYVWRFYFAPSALNSLNLFYGQLCRANRTALFHLYGDSITSRFSTSYIRWAAVTVLWTLLLRCHRFLPFAELQLQYFERFYFVAI